MLTSSQGRSLSWRRFALVLSGAIAALGTNACSGDRHGVTKAEFKRVQARYRATVPISRRCPGNMNVRTVVLVRVADATDQALYDSKLQRTDVVGVPQSAPPVEQNLGTGHDTNVDFNATQYMSDSSHSVRVIVRMDDKKNVFADNGIAIDSGSSAEKYFCKTRYDQSNKYIQEFYVMYNRSEIDPIQSYYLWFNPKFDFISMLNKYVYPKIVDPNITNQG